MSDLIKTRKGIFIPDITVEMFRNTSLEAVEELLASGEMQDIILPSAEPEPKKGEWINKEFYGIGEGSAECSICHKRSSGYKEDDGWSVHCLFHDFCPKCGADMRGEKEETE